MDFVEGLPVSGGKNCILVVVDRFSKFGHFIPLKHPFTASVVAKAFMQQVYRLHGMPSVIVSDRDRIFTSQLWKHLFSLADVSLHMSSAYHPQSDGQTERLNQCLETFLRCFAHACPQKWLEWLYLAEYWYNSSWHSALQMSPFQVLYGYAPQHFGLDVLKPTPVPVLDDWLREKTVITALVRQHLARAQNRMKVAADKNRSERVFAVGDHVYLKIQPYVQSSLAPRANQKLAFRYSGPFPIIAKLGPVAYKLALLESCSIHPVIHVSQLKKALPSSVSVAQLPDQLDGLQVPQKILQRRWDPKGNLEGLVQWSELPASLATWEDLTSLRQLFPRAPAWGQAAPYPGGNVSSATTESDIPAVLQKQHQGNTSSGPPVDPASGPRRSMRQRVKSTRVHGPEWVA